MGGNVEAYYDSQRMQQEAVLLPADLPPSAVPARAERRIQLGVTPEQRQQLPGASFGPGGVAEPIGASSPSEPVVGELLAYAVAEPTRAEKAEVVLAALIARMDEHGTTTLTPEPATRSRSRVAASPDEVRVPSGDDFDAVVEALYQRLGTVRGRGLR